MAPKIPAPVLVEGGDAEALARAELDGDSEMYSPSVARAEAPGVVVPEEALELRAVKGASTTDEQGVPSMLAGGGLFRLLRLCQLRQHLKALAVEEIGWFWERSSSSSGVALVADGGGGSLVSSSGACRNLVEDATSPSNVLEDYEEVIIDKFGQALWRTMRSGFNVHTMVT